LRYLAGLSHLKYLALGGTGITDIGLQRLAGLKALQDLMLNGTKVTDRGWVEFRQALPECKILYSTFYCATPRPSATVSSLDRLLKEVREIQEIDTADITVRP